MKSYSNRDEVPDEYKWNLTDFFKTDEEYNKTLNITSKRVEKLTDFVGCTKDAKKLYSFLKEQFEILVLIENLYVYAYLIKDEDLGKSESLNRLNQAENLWNEFSIKTNFFEPELLKLSNERYSTLFKECENLEEYRFMLDLIYRNKAHSLSEREENIITELSSATSNQETMSQTIINSENDYGNIVLDDGSKVKIRNTNVRKLIKNSTRPTRKKIWIKYKKVLDQYSASNAMFLNEYVKKNIAISKIRNFESTWKEKLFYLNINDKVFKTLVNTTENNLDSLQRFYKLKKDALNIESKLEMWDIPVEMVKEKKKYSIEDAIKINKNAMQILGEDYMSHFNKVFDNHYIDYCEYKGKCSGGYSFSTLDHDSRILMSFNEDLTSVSTIAHEGGHNAHHQYISENNPYQYREQPSLICEVASLTNECLLSDYLSKNGKTKSEKLSGIENILDVIISNLFGAVREGKMEQDMYEYVESGNCLTKEYMDNLSYNSLKKYYGNTVKLNKYSKCDWVTRSHYYMGFYLYSYSICISVACFVANEILKGNKEMLEKYKKFLSAGSDKWPTDVFKMLDIDLESPKVYENAIEFFNKMIDKYEEISKE